MFARVVRSVSRRSCPSRHHQLSANQIRAASAAAAAGHVRGRGMTDSETRQILEEVYAESLSHEDFFSVRGLADLETAFNANMHLGHKRRVGHPAFRDFLFGTRIDMDIIDLEKTVPRLQLALNFVAHIAFRHGIILFVCRPNHRECHTVDSLAVRCGEYAHTRKWARGAMANAAQRLGPTSRLPDCLVVFSCHDKVFNTHISVKEAAALGIPTVGLVDSNVDPRLVTYPVPGNDDSPGSVRLFGHLVTQAVLAGKRKRVQMLTQRGIPCSMESLCSYDQAAISSGQISSFLQPEKPSRDPHPAPTPAATSRRRVLDTDADQTESLWSPEDALYLPDSGGMQPSDFTETPISDELSFESSSGDK